jgi:transposase
VGIGRQQGLGPAKAVSPPASELTNYLCRDPIDFRAGINALSVLVEAILKFDPFSRNLYGFVNKRRNQIKVLYWQRSGFCLWQKRLEEERFQWAFHLEGPVITLTEEQFAWLLEGLDLKQLRPHLGHYDRVRTSPLSSTFEYSAKPHVSQFCTFETGNPTPSLLLAAISSTSLPHTRSTDFS